MSDEPIEDIAASNEAAHEAAGQRPTARFSGSGGISIAVWKTKTEQGRDSYSVRIDRSYKVGDADYKSTPYLRDGDLLRTQQLLSQADQWIEQDKAKGRSAGTGTTASR